MTAGACPTSGCGSGAAYLDTSTVRVTGWVTVRTQGRPLAVRWFCSSLCAALVLGGAEVEVAVRTRLAGVLGSAAATLIETDLDEGRLLERHRGIETARRLIEPDQADGVAQCHVCGCTEDDACAGGCAWVPGGVQDVCTACAPPLPCTTAGCAAAAIAADGAELAAQELAAPAGGEPR